MHPLIEVIAGVSSWRFSLEAVRTTVGKARQNDVALEHDPTASHLHAILERFPAGWCVTDLGSSNGTWVNGERIWSSHRLRHGDEIRLGQTRLVFRDALNAGGAGADEPVVLIREQLVPLRSGQVPPRDATRVSRPGVRAHLPPLRLACLAEHEEPTAVRGEANRRRAGRRGQGSERAATQRITVPSNPLVASRRPSGENSALSTPLS